MRSDGRVEKRHQTLHGEITLLIPAADDEGYWGALFYPRNSPLPVLARRTTLSGIPWENGCGQKVPGPSGYIRCAAPECGGTHATSFD